MSRDRRADKISLFRRITKGRRACLICLQRSSGKNMFQRLRKGTC